MLSEYAKIQPEVQKEIKTQLDKFFQEKQKEQQFQLSKIQNHVHSGTDAPKIPSTSLTSYIPIDTTTPGGVFNYALSIGQGVFLEPDVNNPPSLVPIPVITGGGAAPADAFQGGEALNGTIFIFQNVDTLATELWVKVDSFWYGVALPLTAPAVV